MQIEVQNFGQTTSNGGSLKVEQVNGEELGEAQIPDLKPFERTIVNIESEKPVDRQKEYRMTIFYGGKQREELIVNF